MIARVKAAVVAFVKAHPSVVAVAKHAAYAAAGVVIAAVSVGGVHSVTTGVLVAAGSAAVAVVEVAVRAYLASKAPAATPPAAS